MTKPGNVGRRQFLRRLAAGTFLPCLLAGSGVVGYALSEAKRCGVYRLDIALRNLPAAFEGTTIAFLTDTHHGSLNPLGYLEKVVALTNSLRPDIIALGGDYVERRHRHEPGGSHRRFVVPGVAVLAKLRAPMGRFAVLGNHDYSVDAALTRRALADHGLTELTNAGVWLEREGARLRICGVDDSGRGHPWLTPALGDMTTKDAAVVLTHNPDYVEKIHEIPAAVDHGLVHRERREVGQARHGERDPGGKSKKEEQATKMHEATPFQSLRYNESRMAARDLASAAPASSAIGGTASRTSPVRTRAVEVPRPPSSGSLPPPALALKYRTLFLIGRGGMGTVEAALQLLANEGASADHAANAYQRVVALKRLLPDAARDSRRVEMFLREARLAALLDHPNVVRAFDYGEVDGELFLALEYIEGQTLSHVLRALNEKGVRLAPSLAAHVLAEVCAGLHAAHELRDPNGQALSLVHRDVSPQNVMISYDGHVRLLDFGVAKIEAESTTKTGEVKGKTAYMSPEQAMGDVLDRRSDLFGVGAVLFECLAARRMWGEGTDMEMIRKLALEKPPRLEDVVADAPAELCALYTRLVAVDVKDRPAHAREVAEALRALVPQGAEAAQRELRAVLDEQFHGRAEEQHRRLTRKLEEVAPDQARELRESVSPDPADFARPSVATVTAPPSMATPAPPAKKSRNGLVAVVAIAAVAAVVVWRFAASPAPPPPVVHTAEPVATTAPTATATTPAVTASAAPPVVTAPPTARAPARIPAQSSIVPRPSVAASAPTAPRATAPPPSAKPPPDVDEKPF